jgi:hypothetical protein
MLGKMLLTKKAHEKSLMSKSKVQWQARTARLAGEKMAQSESGPGRAFIEGGGVKEVSACAGVSGRGGAVLERGIFCLREGLFGSFSSEV